MDRFLKTVDSDGFQKKPPPSYFYLDWTTRTAEWRTVENSPSQKNLKFTAIVRWKDLKNLSINICSNYHAGALNSWSTTETKWTNVACLKSHLQKSIRRSDTWKALKTAFHLMELNMEQFLRRLAIIALEDSLPLEGFSVLIWFIAATSKGYILSNSQKCWCLGYVYRICECKWRDEPHATTPESEFSLFRGKLYQLPEKISTLIYSAQFRKAYGGMAGDKSMIDHLCHVWVEREIDTYDHYLASPQNLMLPPIEPLTLNEWNLAAMDYHCCPNIITSLHDTYDDLTETEIRSAIWFCSSNLTDKRMIETGTLQIAPVAEMVRVWEKINRKFFNLAKFLLKTTG